MEIDLVSLKLVDKIPSTLTSSPRENSIPLRRVDWSRFSSLRREGDREVRETVFSNNSTFPRKRIWSIFVTLTDRNDYRSSNN